ncbi:MAG: gliding motility-associated C-terminal domain-containing protein [Pedobacter sp.]|nr:gliding motility-associated C-terminal domain-containing protein [Pedobacter sp.]
MIFRTRTVCLFILLFFSTSWINAQVCTGDLGAPILGAGTDFGSGTNAFGSPLGSTTNYNFVLGTPNDGSYTIVKSTANLNPGWHPNIVNHTPNDPNGYMMVVNASNTPGIFYQTTVTGLCPGVTYEFASYIINILRNPGIKPNIRFTIENDGVPFHTFSTNDILEGSATDWIKYGTIFSTPPNVGTITLKMTNQNPGGSGNDLALDDITFRPCGPRITPVILSTSSSTATICEGQSTSIDLSATVSSVYVNPVYQWQENNGAGWVNLSLPGAQSTQITIPYPNAVAGTYTYQLLVAEAGNINAPNCRIVSSPLTVTVSANPVAVASFTGLACEGSDVTLNVNTGATFSWTGPNGFSSTLQNPVLTNLFLNNSGTYTVVVTNAAGCYSTSNVTLQILPKPIVLINIPNNETTICEKSTVQLIASGGTAYRWEPAQGLSNPAIANPVASPTQTTTYTVSATNGACTVTTSVVINVTKSTKADAGVDQKALAGQSVNLEGKVTGDNITYLWSPPDYLDDPTKLNPTASPPRDITYRLTVQSACGISTDDVFVKIYPKVEIQNTFTPNGDGKNDTWNITALEAFTTHEIKVVNRNGQTVFNNKGSYLPWDGKFNQKDVPVGSYYYTIYLNDDFKALSGWVFVIR